MYYETSFSKSAGVCQKTVIHFLYIKQAAENLRLAAKLVGEKFGLRDYH